MTINLTGWNKNANRRTIVLKSLIFPSLILQKTSSKSNPSENNEQVTQ